MHIPDGFLTNPVCAATTGLSLAGVTFAAAGVARSWGTRDQAQDLSGNMTPAAGLTAAVAAAIFAGQMLNFPVAAGTSGHLIGAALATALLGWPRAVLVMVSVLTLQCFLFADGGIYALGANVLNMALVAVAVSAAIYGWLGINAATVAVAGWFSVMAATLACSLQLAISGVAAPQSIFAAMLPVHAVIGAGEALLTVLTWIGITRGLANFTVATRVAILVIAACMLAGLVSPMASPFPDGLEHVAESLGFGGLAAAGISTPFADYATPGVVHQAVSVGIAGIVGTLAVFAMIWLPSQLRPQAEKQR